MERDVLGRYVLGEMLRSKIILLRRFSNLSFVVIWEPSEILRLCEQDAEFCRCWKGLGKMRVKY